MIHFRSPFNLASLAVLALATLAGLVLIPADAQVPVHWGLDLQVTQTLPKFQGLLQMPLATAVIWAIFWGVSRFGNAQRQAGQARALNIALPALTAILALVQVAIVVTAR